MANTKKYTPEEIAEKLDTVAALSRRGMATREAVRRVGLSELAFHRFREQAGIGDSVLLRELKALRTENERLRKAVEDLIVEKRILLRETRGSY